MKKVMIKLFSLLIVIALCFALLGSNVQVFADKYEKQSLKIERGEYGNDILEYIKKIGLIFLEREN